MASVISCCCYHLEDAISDRANIDLTNGDDEPITLAEQDNFEEVSAEDVDNVIVLTIV